MAIWCQCTAIYRGDEAGKAVTYYPEDWIQLSKTQAIYLQGEGIVKIPDNTIYKHLSLHNCGVGIFNMADNVKLSVLFPGLLRTKFLSKPELPFLRTILWDLKTPVSYVLFPAGLHLLSKWEVLAPIIDYDKLIQNFVSKDDAKWASEILPDLRLPMFNIGLLFIRKSEAGESVVDLWNSYIDDGHEKDISFVCAVYQIKPLLLALPTLWGNSNNG